METKKEHISRASSGPPRMRTHFMPIPPDEAAKRSKLFTCNRIEFQKKNSEYERNKKTLRAKYTTTRSLEAPPHEKTVQFITKVQIRTTRTPVTPTSDEQSLNDKCSEFDSGVVQDLPNVDKDDSTCLFPSHVPLKTDAIELLWLDSNLETPDDRANETHLVRTLSRQLNENRLLLHRKHQDRPTASFAAPTKGEINLLIQSPDFKKAIKTDRCSGHKILLMNRGRALSLSGSNYYTVISRLPRTGARPLTGKAYEQDQKRLKTCPTCNQSL